VCARVLAEVVGRDLW